jgi:hypothetical protein
MRTAFLLAMLSLGACASPAIEQAAQPATACLNYSGIGPCFTGRDITDRTNREDIANRTRLRGQSLADITDRANREDVGNRTRLRGQSLADITDRANREDVGNRTRLLGQALADVTNRNNRDNSAVWQQVCP